MRHPRADEKPGMSLSLPRSKKNSQPASVNFQCLTAHRDAMCALSPLTRRLSNRKTQRKLGTDVGDNGNGT